MMVSEIVHQVQDSSFSSWILNCTAENVQIDFAEEKTDYVSTRRIV